MNGLIIGRSNQKVAGPTRRRARAVRLMRSKMFMAIARPGGGVKGSIPMDIFSPVLGAAAWPGESGGTDPPRPAYKARGGHQHQTYQCNAADR